jgi:hypothetical protein
MRSLGMALVIGGAAYLTLAAIWTGWIFPFSRRQAAARGESYDHERASVLRGWQLLTSIAAVLFGVWLLANY